jgi:hypothetical protein
MFLDIIHRLLYSLKTVQIPFYNNVSETGFCLRPQVKPTQSGPIELAPISGQNTVSETF